MKKSLFTIALMATLTTMSSFSQAADTNTPVDTSKKIEKISEKSTDKEKNAKVTKQLTSSTSINNKPVATASNDAAVILQLGAFTDPNLAYKQAAKASLLGLPAKVVPMKKKNGSTVRVVRSSTRLPQAEAEKVAANLRQQQMNTILISQ